MARPELVPDIRNLVRTARAKGVSVIKKDFHILDIMGISTVNIRVTPLRPSEKGSGRFYVIFFEVIHQPIEASISSQKKRNGKISRTSLSKKFQRQSVKDRQALELLQAKKNQEHLIRMSEDFEIGKEKLIAANEELQSSNEELTTVNDELQTRNTEMAQLTSDLVSFMGAIEIPIVLVGSEGQIRRFTPQSEKQFKILSSDIGRKLGDFKPDLIGVQLEDIITKVIKNGTSEEIETQDKIGHWYQLTVNPCRTSDGKIDGAVISLIDIHKQKTALEATKAAERSLELVRADALRVIESNPIPFLVVKSDRTIWSPNEAFFNKFYPLSAGRPPCLPTWNDSPWNTPELNTVLDKTLSEGLDFNDFEIKCHFPTVGQKSLILNARQVELPGSGIKAALIAIEDITLRKQGELDQARTLELLEEISRRIPGLVFQFVLRPDGGSYFPFASAGIRHIFGLTPEDVHDDSSKFMSLIHPEDRTNFVTAVKHSGETLDVLSIEFRLKFPDGKQLWVLCHGVAERCEKGVLWNGYISDITDRKAAEQLLKKSEEKYRNLAASSYDGVMVVRRDGSIEFANRKLEELFGYNPGELLNQQYSALVPEKIREAHAKYHGKYLIEPKPKEMSQEGLNLVGRRKDGTEFPVVISLNPFLANSELLVNCIVRDVSNEKKIEEKRKTLAAQERALRDEAIRSNRNKDEFLATLSHELRTPLTTILGWTQQLMQKKMDSETNEAFFVIERSAKALGQLVDDLLDISRIQAGKISLNIQPVDLIETVKLAISSTSVMTAKKNITFETNFPTTRCTILGDPYRLQQIFWNILTNAVKFTPQQGKISVELNIVPHSNREYAQIKVRDTGMGIKPEFLTRIFERFSQVDSSMTRVYGGLGLGLAIVKSLVDQHDGIIEAQSEGEGKGSTFTLSFPMPKDKQVEIIEKQPPSLPARLDGLKVLVIDDNVDNLYLFEMILKSLGATVKTGESAQRCLEIFPIFLPDILLSDISMPGEDGYSLIRKIRALGPESGGNTPAIALTAYAAPEDIKIALDAGYSSHVAKPVDKQVLAKTIQGLIHPQQEK